AILPRGMEAASEWLRIDVSDDSFAALSRYADDRGASGNARVSAAPSVFCTWYYYGLSVTQEDVLSDLSKLRRRGISFDVFQLDEGWEMTLGDWRLNHKFSMSLPEIAHTISDYGFMPGIWTSPFIAHETAPVTKEHPEWLLRRRDGHLCLFPMNDTVYRVLDITNPEVLEWIEQLYRMLSVCGFMYHKLDFTRAPVIAEGAVFHDPTVPMAMAYRNAIKAVRKGIGEDAYLLICGGLYDAVIGLADGQRAGSDVLGMWSNPDNPGSTTVSFTMKQTILRSFMNAWWNNDPDALMIRRQREAVRGLSLSYGLLNDEEVKTTALCQYFSGGLICSTEPMDSIEDDRLMVLRHILPPIAVRTTARDMFGGKRYPSIIDTEVRNGAWHTVTIINWEYNAWQPDLVLNSDLTGGLVPDRTYRVCEFFSGMITENLKPGDPVPVPKIPGHGSIHLKIEAEDPDMPSVVASTGHFSFGGELTRLEIENGILIFDTYLTVKAPVRYTIQLPKGMHCASLPPCCSAFNGRLEIYLVESGNCFIEIPLRQDIW
ncbi:MAG: alpha-galactosidase, partial [Clostridia bacterium]|nr:alpha-galactosidase [Clostridia bacterium]